MNKFLSIATALIIGIGAQGIRAASTLDEEQKRFEGFAIDLKNESDQPVEITNIEGFHEKISGPAKLTPKEAKTIVVKPKTRFKVNFIKSDVPSKEKQGKWWQAWKTQPTEHKVATYLVEIKSSTGKSPSIIFGRKSWLSRLFGGGLISSSGVSIQTTDVSAKPTKDGQVVMPKQEEEMSPAELIGD